MSDARIAYRDDGKGIDEITVGPCLFHLEQMDDNYYWIGIDVSGKETLHIRFGSKSPILCTIDEDTLNEKPK